LIEELKHRSAPFVVSCALHVSLVAGLILTQHWVSSAIALHAPVLPVQLVTLEAPAPIAPPEAPAPPAAPLKPPRLLAPPKALPRPKDPPAARLEERPVLPPPTPIASAPTPAPAPAAPAAPPQSVALDGPAEPVAGPPATTILSSSPGDPAARSRTDAPAAPAPAGARTAAVAPEGITQYARPQGGYQVRPSYPAAPRRLGVQGTTLLRVHVLADGRIGDVLVEKSAGHPDLDDAATDAVKRWRFDPARRGREAVAMWVLLPVEFKLR
jgi:protein TonB